MEDQSVDREHVKRLDSWANVVVVETGRRRPSPAIEWGDVPESGGSAMPTRILFMMPPMSIFGLLRTVSIVSSALVCGMAAAARATPSDPDRFITSIYANGRETKV
jgi:hypothetical protein